MMPVPIDSGFPLEREEFANKIDQKYKEIMTVNFFFFFKKLIKIFYKDYLVFPVHKKENDHLAVLIICHPKNISSFSSSTKESDKPPYIIYFDSFGIIDENLLIVLR